MTLRLLPGLAMLGAFTLGAFAQVSPKSEPDPEALRLLRQTIAEQSRNPDRIIRTLEKELATTNAPARPSSPKGGPGKNSRRVEQPAPPSPVIAAMESMGFRVLHAYGLTAVPSPLRIVFHQDVWSGGTGNLDRKSTRLNSSHRT